jgi:uncharacterized Tic20 family protein
MSEVQSRDERMWGMLCHLSGLAIFVGVPFGNIVVPLILWLIKKDESSYVNYHGKEALNFQITVILCWLVCVPLMFVLIGIPLAIVITFAEYYRYPLTIRFL